MDTSNFLTIAQAAEHLNCSTGFVRKRISLTEANQPGGWPKSLYVNLQPNGVKSLYRVRRDALDKYLVEQMQKATMDEGAEACTTGACTF